MTIEEMRSRKNELGYTLEQIAQLSGVPVGTVRKIFCGITQSPRYDTIQALEKALEQKQDQDPVGVYAGTSLCSQTGTAAPASTDTLPEDSRHLRILICDDDARFTRQLHHLLITFYEEKDFPIPEIQIYHNGADLLEDTGSKDIVFLDIEMPGKNGIFVGRQLKEQSPELILFIITSYPEYLDDALRFHVFRYLSKPLSRQRLFSNLEDAMQLYHSRTPQILLETKDESISIYTKDIVCIEITGQCTTVYTTQGDFLSVHRMNYWLANLPKGSFYSPHRSYLINLMHVAKFTHNSITFDKDKPTAYLTRRKYTEFKNVYSQYLESTRTSI